jgi:membrane-associated protein
LDTLLHEIVRLLLEQGPWLVFFVSLAETALFVGLVLPAEATVIVAAFLADRHYFEVWQVFAGAFVGGLLGDQIGYALGRRRGTRVSGRSWLGRAWLRNGEGTRRLFQRYSALAITLARFISFVRTFMPAFAGMTAIPYRRFLFYDFLGVLGWSAASVGIGYAAGASWRRLADHVGRAAFVAASIALLIACVMTVRAFRSRRRRRRA